jgi:hypothetical protein
VWAAITLAAIACVEQNPCYERECVWVVDAAGPDRPLPGSPDVDDNPETDPADAAVESGQTEPPMPVPDAAEIEAGESGTGPDAGSDIGDEAGSASIAGLVAHWPLDEGQGSSASDVTGNQNEGALVNGPSWVEESAPISGVNPSALRLDGADDRVELSIRTLPGAEAPKTIALWFRNSETTSRLRNLVALFNETDRTGIHLGLDGDGLAVWRWGEFESILSSAGAPDQSWHHAAYSWDGSTHQLYLDGTLVDSSTAAVLPGPIRTARLGIWKLPEIFGGDLDEVRIYDRALSDAEVLALSARLP